MNSAAKGAAFERRCRKDLEEAGWTVVRAAASKGPADLWAVRQENGRSRMLVIQAKAGRQAMGPGEWNRFCQHAELILATPIVVDKAPGVSRPQWWRITGLKDGSGGPQPRAPFDIDAWQED